MYCIVISVTGRILDSTVKGGTMYQAAIQANEIGVFVTKLQGGKKMYTSVPVIQQHSY